MIENLLILHKPSSMGVETPPFVEFPLFAFKTCLRSIYAAYATDGESISHIDGYDVYRGRYAYQFLLEVVCGLHSPVVGETEVFGQFKAFLQSAILPASLQKIFLTLVADAKKVRQNYLTDLGGQSYGSLLRRLIQSPANVSVIGAGEFVQQLLPWIYKDENTVSIYARNPKKALSMFSREKFPRLKILALQDVKVRDEYLVIAAPLSAQKIQDLVYNRETLVIDLRGESEQDPCQFNRYVGLKSFFAQIQENQAQLSGAKVKAQAAILELSHKRDLSESLRPFGWDDLCAW